MYRRKYVDGSRAVYLILFIASIILSCDIESRKDKSLIQFKDFPKDFEVLWGDTLLYQKDRISFSKSVDIDRILLIDDKIYILQLGRRVEIFNQDGKYIGPLGKRGEGPGEYLLPENIFYCHNLIGLHDAMGKIVFYSKGNEHLYDIEIVLEGGSFDIICENDYLLIYPRSFKTSFPYHIWKVDRNTGAFLQGYLPVNMKYAGYFNKGMFEGRMWVNESFIFVFNSIYGKLFRINKNNEKVDTLNLSLPSYLEQFKWPPKSLNASMRQVENAYHTSRMNISDFYVHKDWYIMRIFMKPDPDNAMGITVYLFSNESSGKAYYLIFSEYNFFTFRDGFFYQYQPELRRDVLVRYGIAWEKLASAVN